MSTPIADHTPPQCPIYTQIMGETRDPELMCVCVVPRRSKDLLANPKKVVESATANEPLNLGFARSTRNKVEQKYTLRTW